MTGMREGDIEPFTKFRPSRFFSQAGSWYFRTREGTTEGPFEQRFQAKNRLDAYLRIFKDLQLKSFSSGFYAAVGNPKLEPIQMRWR